ncbi:hypothetical protein SAMN04244574_01287 [Azotobacter beijerinckii]|uniref:Uncharacterized protein n=1 Tax=Azotobacter beijerinckii TaxID=170623 RepID=A0A1I4B3G2_9GAMM|nr:hypothetical protein SAMN04244571_00757 [Azotobacter beijerinckii]SFK63073.1 hypothetical protein SAMN04244574_01287 [Azotobacter beijerinckii]
MLPYPIKNAALQNAPRSNPGPPPGGLSALPVAAEPSNPTPLRGDTDKFRVSPFVVLVKQPRALPDCAPLHHPEPVGQGGRVRPGTRPVRIPQRQKERYA